LLAQDGAPGEAEAGKSASAWAGISRSGMASRSYRKARIFGLSKGHRQASLDFVVKFRNTRNMTTAAEIRTVFYLRVCPIAGL
jgi:hypothetical protein